MAEPDTRPLSVLLAEIPDRIFWSLARGEAVPSYNRIFAEVLRRVHGLEDLSEAIQLHELFTGRVPNLSSFQRAVAKEAQARRSTAATA